MKFAVPSFGEPPEPQTRPSVMGNSGVVPRASGVINAIGAGQDWSADLTLAGWRALRESKTVFFFGELVGFADFLVDHGLSGKDLSGLARFGEPRTQTYHRAARRILEAAVRESPVAWVTQGNPAVLCGVTSSLLRLVPESNLQVHLVPAPSAIDSVLADLKLRTLGTGIQVLDANRMLLYRQRPAPALACLVLQVARVETRLNCFDAQPKPRSLERLCKLLLEVFPANHPCILVTASRHCDTPSSQVAVELGKLSLSASRVGPWTSLYLPPATQAIADTAVESQLESFSHLEDMYETPLSRAIRVFTGTARSDER